MPNKKRHGSLGTWTTPSTQGLPPLPRLGVQPVTTDCWKVDSRVKRPSPSRKSNP
jgi:hypothetical protein